MAQYVKVELSEGRAYTYLWDDLLFALEPGDAVMLPASVVHNSTFSGTVLRVLDGPDPHYDGPYKAVLAVNRDQTLRCADGSEWAL
jgi:hypothetical protein